MELTPNVPLSLLTKRSYDKAMALASTGFDIIKEEYKKSGSKKTKHSKVPSLGPVQAGHGWYVQAMSGLQRHFPKGWNALRTTSQLQSSSYQTSEPHKLTLSQISRASIMAGVTETDIEGITTLNVDTFLTTAQYKTIFCNLSNISQMYEFYYVVAKKDTDQYFDDDVTTYTDLIDTPNAAPGLSPTMFNWSPDKIPALMDKWRVLSKAVFRLESGATGEINIKDQLYKKVNKNTAPTSSFAQPHIAGIYTELWVRWWGAPTGLTAPSPVNITKIVFGDTGVTTGFVMERCINWFKADIDAPKVWYWESTVPQAAVGTEIIVTHADTDDAITQAD